MISSPFRSLAFMTTLFFFGTVFCSKVALAQDPQLTVNFANQLLTSDADQADCLTGQPAGTLAFTFSLTVLADQPNTRIGDTQVYFDYNVLGFGTSIVAGSAISVQKGALLSDAAVDAFFGEPVLNDNTNARVSIFTEYFLPTVPTFAPEVSSSTPDELLIVCIVIADQTQTSNLVFNDLTRDQMYLSTNASNYDVVLGSGLDQLLPVELVSFEALADGHAVVLNWHTAAETNNAGFEVQVWEAGSGWGDEGSESAWSVLGFVEGKGTTTAPQAYSHWVHELEAGRHVFRLKQVDYDGTFAYSPEVEVTIEMAESYALSAAYPNPFNPETSFTLAVGQQQEVTIEVFDVLGRKVAVLYRGGMQANASRVFAWEAGDHPSGLYFIRVVGEQFVQTRQVTLLK